MSESGRWIRQGRRLVVLGVEDDHQPVKEREEFLGWPWSSEPAPAPTTPAPPPCSVPWWWFDALAPAKCPKTGVTADEEWLITKESGWNPRAKNPKSTAFGLGQLIVANRERYLGKENADTTNCDAQLCAFRKYVKDRYGTAKKAKEHWLKKGWY